jgi:hypothetical protein
MSRRRDGRPTAKGIADANRKKGVATADRREGDMAASWGKGATATITEEGLRPSAG